MAEVFSPVDWRDVEEQVLAPYAMHTRDSRGRKYPEPDHAFRTPYQRDRDRVVHSTAFRRLMYKTQVLVNQVSDYHRTRLTHTLEVVQISRTLARRLGLNEDLTEAIALMHDLGHPPFGHAGEEALNECMREHDGFEHNRQGLRLVEELEYRYADFPGLNLTWEVREAQAMHSRRHDAPEIAPYLAVGRPLLEAQVVDAADSLAYTCHDVDDALNLGLITPEQLADVPFWALTVQRVRELRPELPAPQRQPALIRALIDWQAVDLLQQTQLNLREQAIASIADVRKATSPLVGPSPQVRGLKQQLSQFLFDNVYRHFKVMRLANKGQRIVQALFAEFCRSPEQLPPRYARLAAQNRERTVCDYVAGMTDRYAQDEYLRLFQPFTTL